MFSGFRIPSDDVILLALSNSDLQIIVRWFATKYEAVGTRTSTAMVLRPKGVNCPLRVRVTAPSGGVHVSRILFMSQGEMELGPDRWIDVASAVMQRLYQCIVVKREVSQRAKMQCKRFALI